MKVLRGEERLTIRTPVKKQKPESAECAIGIFCCLAGTGVFNLGG